MDKRHLYALVALLVSCFANTAPAYAADDAPFSLTSSDLTGPISVENGSSFWRTAAIHNTTDQYLLTFDIRGSGEFPDWVKPDYRQIELAPGEQELIKFSVNAPIDTIGVHDLGLIVTTVNAETTLILGESPLLNSFSRELMFSVEVTPASPVLAEQQGGASGAASPMATPKQQSTTASQIAIGYLGLIATPMVVWQLWCLRQTQKRERERKSAFADEFFSRHVGPQSLKVVELTSFSEKDMHHYVAEVEQHPTRCVETLDRTRASVS